MDSAAGILCGAIDFGRAEAACPDQRCLLTVMQRHGQGLVQMLWRILGNQADVADAYQETLCKLTVLLNDGRSWNRKGFIYRLAANVAIDMLRRRRRDADARQRLNAPAEPGTDPASACVQHDEVQRLQAAIDALPDRLRQVLILREFGELDYRAIASALHITAGTARQYRRLAVVKLADSLGASEGTNDHER